MPGTCISSQLQLEATEEFKLGAGLLRLTQVLGRECLGKRAREAVWRPVARLCPKCSGLSERTVAYTGCSSGREENRLEGY